MLATVAPIAITGAGNADTGLTQISSISLTLSAAGTVNIRENTGAGTIVASFVLAAAGGIIQSFEHPIRSRTGTFFVENTAGNVAGGVAGRT